MEAELADGEGHAGEGGERRQIHEYAHDAEHRMGDVVEHQREALAALPHLAERAAEDRRHDQHRHHVALGDVADDVGRHHLQ
jgi:hypothetical protein